MTWICAGWRKCVKLACPKCKKQGDTEFFLWGNELFLDLMPFQNIVWSVMDYSDKNPKKVTHSWRWIQVCFWTGLLQLFCHLSRMWREKSCAVSPGKETGEPHVSSGSVNESHHEMAWSLLLLPVWMSVFHYVNLSICKKIILKKLIKLKYDNPQNLMGGFHCLPWWGKTICVIAGNTTKKSEGLIKNGLFFIAAFSTPQSRTWDFHFTCCSLLFHALMKSDYS